MTDDHYYLVKSFVEMTKYLLSQTGSEGLFLLSERISQDPLENYFGKQRSRGGRCDNPTIKDCLINSLAIRAQQSIEMDQVRGNCRGKKGFYLTPPRLITLLYPNVKEISHAIENVCIFSYNYIFTPQH